MKKTIFTLFFSVAITYSYAADLYVNGSGNPNTYTTIQAAVNASSSGDNIYVATVGTYSEAVSINNKSLFIIAAVADEEFTISGSFALNPGSGNEITIIGMYNGNITTSGSGTVNVISSFISSLTGSSGVRTYLYDCDITNSCTINNGGVKGCTLSSLNVSGGIANDTIRIMGNYLTALYWNNTSAYMEICNNFLNNYTSSSYNTITIANRRTVPGGTNLIANNTIVFNIQSTNLSYSGIYFQSANDGQNLVIANNYIRNLSAGYGLAISSGYTNIINALLLNNAYYTGSLSNGFTGSSSIGNFTANYSYSSTTGELSGNDGLDLGANLIEYRDIDNSINDIGTDGGPHAWDNYNTTTGKAAIFNLELPFQLYIGGTHNIKAKGVHKN